LTGDQITLSLQQKSINPEIADAFHKIVDQKDKIAALDAEIARREGETQKIYDDQQRLRELSEGAEGQRRRARAYTALHTAACRSGIAARDAPARIGGFSSETRPSAVGPRFHDRKPLA
jgi:hypothetical protein